MDATAKWLICAGSGAFLPIAAAIVAAGYVGGAEWEPSAACACTRAACGDMPGVIVGALAGERPLDVACRLSELVRGRVVLCDEGARSLAGEAVARGVVVVEPAALARLLMDLELPGGDVCREAAAHEPSGASPTTCEGPCGGGVARDFAHAPAPLRPDASGGMRSAGCPPRTGVPEQLAQERARQGGHAASVAGEGPAHVAAAAACVPLPAALEGLSIGEEPLVMTPVVDLPQVECRVAGEEEHVPTICLASARGGVGKTSLAVVSALSLAREGMRVALVDLDYQFGTCLGFLGASETYGLVDDGALPGQLRVDARTLARCRTTPEGSLSAYEFCHVPEQAELLAGMSAQLVRAARAGADVAIVDLPPGVGEAAAQVLDLADRCLLVTDQRAFSLESLAVQQDLCVRMGVARTKLVTVINRCDPRHRDEGFLSRAQFEVHTPQAVRVVDGGAEVAQMLAIGRAGELLAMRNKFALSVADMAHALCADLGCSRRGVVPSVPAPAPQPTQSLEAREGLFGRRHKAKRGEQVPCPF